MWQGESRLVDSATTRFCCFGSRAKAREPPVAPAGSRGSRLASYSSVQRRLRQGTPGTRARLRRAPRASARAGTPCDIIKPRDRSLCASHSPRQFQRCGGAMAAANPWDPASAPSAAGLLLNHWVASGMVTEVRGGGPATASSRGRQNSAVM